MSTQSMAYDNPAYQVPLLVSGATAVGANGVTTKFAAFTASLIKSVTLGPNIATTAAGSQPLLYAKSGTATSTTTLSVLTSASTAAAYNDLATDLALAQGDQFWVTHGTDATCSMSVAIELRLAAGANITN